MREQIRQKLAAGFSCLKLKIGSLDFATELELLAEIRAEAGPDRLMLRVDANGAFAPAEALDKLHRFGGVWGAFYRAAHPGRAVGRNALPVPAFAGASRA